jgi:hypothetical protein
MGFFERELRHILLETSTFMGERFPEYDAWLATKESDAKENSRRLEELGNDPQRTMLYLLERMTGKTSPETGHAKKSIPSKPRRRLGPISPPARAKAAHKKSVGRNDRCPCDSGKKFKNCCMNKPGLL